MHGSHKLMKDIALGIREDAISRDKLASILGYNSAKYRDAFISLKDYVERIKEVEKNFYYTTGEGMIAVGNSPIFEKLNGKGNKVF